MLNAGYPIVAASSRHSTTEFTGLPPSLCSLAFGHLGCFETIAVYVSDQIQMPSIKHAGAKSEHSTQQPSEPQPQKTISELFATSKQGSKARELDDIPGASPSKRLKRSHPASAAETFTPSVRTMRADEMYTFSSPTARRTSEVIDLTGGSQCASPLKKKANGFRSTNMAPHTGPRKLTVVNLKRAPKTDPNEYFDRVWKQLDVALSAIFSESQLPCSMEELYKGVEIACRQGRASALNAKLCERCKRHMSGEVKESLMQKTETSSDVELLGMVVRAWSSWSKYMDVIRSIFFYLDRSYLLHSALSLSIEEMGTTEFRTHVFLATALQQRIVEGACDLVRVDREGSQNRQGEALFRDAIKMFHSLTTYSQFFEPILMAKSAQYFGNWAKNSVSRDDLGGYVEKCGNLFHEELTRCDIYGLDQTTKKSLETYLEDILVDERQTRLLVVEDVGDLLTKDRQATLSQLFLLLQRRHLGEKLKPAFEAFIVKCGSEIVFDENREQEMVTRLLEFKRKLDSIWEHPFQRNEGLGHTLREAFETFINKSQRSNMTWGTDNPKPGEMIAKYVDMVLKGGTKAVRASGASQRAVSKTAEDEDQEALSEDEDVEIGRQLDQVLDLFRFVHGKAVFEAFYKGDLARRLLLGKSASSDSEKSMLTRLKSGKLRLCIWAFEILMKK